jgi:hypothetical protein
MLPAKLHDPDFLPPRFLLDPPSTSPLPPPYGSDTKRPAGHQEVSPYFYGRAWELIFPLPNEAFRPFQQPQNEAATVKDFHCVVWSFLKRRGGF